MLHKQISVSYVFAYAGWLTALGVWVVSWVADSCHLGQASILIAAASAAATVRLWQLDAVRDIQNMLTIIREVESADRRRPVRPMH